MAKLSGLDKAIASTQADIGVLELVLVKLIAQKTQPTKKPTAGRKVRKLGSVLDEATGADLQRVDGRSGRP